MNLMEAAIAAKLGGGGGGGAVSSVNGKTGDVVLTAADFDDSFKDALLDCFANVAWATEDGQQYYDALEAALYPPADLLSISAVFEQGETVIYDTDSLDVLKPMLTVTANYDNGTSKTVTGYTLNGTLTVGTSTITVSYGGKTATFDVVVSYIDPAYQQVEWIGATGTQYIATGIVPKNAPKLTLDFESQKSAGEAFQKLFGAEGESVTGGRKNRFSVFIGGANNVITATMTENTINSQHTASEATINFDSATYVNSRLVYQVDSVARTLKVGNTTATFSGNSMPVCANELFLLCSNVVGIASNYSVGKFYGSTYEDADGNAYYYVPCYRKSDGVIGVFDKVSKSFKGNSGTGLFTKGNDRG